MSIRANDRQLNDHQISKFPQFHPNIQNMTPSHSNNRNIISNKQFNRNINHLKNEYLYFFYYFYNTTSGLYPALYSGVKF